MNITLKIRGASLALALLIIMNVRVRAAGTNRPIPGGYKKGERVKLVLEEGLVEEDNGPIEVPHEMGGTVVGPDPDEIKYLLVLFDNQQADDLAWGVAPEDIARTGDRIDMLDTGKGKAMVLDEYEVLDVNSSLLEMPSHMRGFRQKQLVREIGELSDKLIKLAVLEKQLHADKKMKQEQLDFIKKLILEDPADNAAPAADLDLPVATAGLPKLPTAIRMNSLQAFQSNVPTQQEITVRAALAKTKPALCPGDTPDFPDDETPHDSLKKALDARPALADAETLRLPADHHPAQAVAADFGAAEVLNALKPETREVRFGRE